MSNRMQATVSGSLTGALSRMRQMLLGAAFCRDVRLALQLQYGVRRLNTCMRCILRTSNPFLRCCRAKIESRLELGEGCASIGRRDLGTGPSVQSPHADRGNPVATPFLSIGHLWGANMQSFHPPTARRTLLSLGLTSGGAGGAWREAS
jgi:hypothetical protein